MTQVKLNREKIIDFLVEQTLEDMTVKQILNEAVSTGNPKIQAILDKPYTTEGEERMVALGAPEWMVKAYRKGDEAVHGSVCS